ncbi:STAS domain-containing protein [Bailinhaonella thermotolerans]|uniref:STAS domain-containing protein n=1 Tax=Bailinhaonella thermotolerans TaxID=1070861 RepID=UPI00192A6911|nr:STAS domain-containing protein [Bailinhaonella thermotolerans]
MDFSATVEHRGGNIVVVSVRGELDFLSSPALKDAFAAFGESPARYLVVDLTGTTFCDVSGAHTIVAAHGAAVRGGGLLAVSGALPLTRRLLDLIGGGRVPVYPSLTAALRARRTRSGTSCEVLATRTRHPGPAVSRARPPGPPRADVPPRARPPLDDTIKQSKLLQNQTSANLSLLQNRTRKTFEMLARLHDNLAAAHRQGFTCARYPCDGTVRYHQDKALAYRRRSLGDGRPAA